jgi:membrane protein YdbS with pleckstrin-like domain
VPVVANAIGRRRRTYGETARVRETHHERVYLDARRHGVVLMPSLLRAFLIAGIGGFLVSLGWPLPAAGALLVGAAALLALRAVWKWERTHVIVTDDKLALVRGTLRRRTAAVRLERVGAVEIDQSMLGRLLGYGTLIAGPLEITYVPQPRSVYGLVESLSP